MGAFDLLLVDGDPTTDITILQDQTRLLAIMKNGEFHKPPQSPNHQQGSALTNTP